MPPKKKVKSWERENDDWNDDELIRDWDDAMDEFKRYHSLEARGVDTEKALAAYDEAIKAGADEAKVIEAVFGEGDMVQNLANIFDEMRQKGEKIIGEESGATEHHMEVESGRAEHEAEDEDEEGEINDTEDPENYPSSSHHAPMPHTEQDNGTGTEAPHGHNPHPIPTNGGPAMFGGKDTVYDPAQQAMQAWYWAGYYQGLYDAEQRAKRRDNS